MKTIEAVKAYKILKRAKLTKMDEADKLTVIKAMRALRPVAETYDKDTEEGRRALQDDRFDDMQQKAQKHNEAIQEKKQDGLMRVLHFEADGHRSTVFFFPDSPHFGGLSCAYFIDDDEAISLILSGYGHYGNPALHWIGRGLSDKAEAEIARIEYDEKVCSGALIRLIAPLGYEDQAYERCGDVLQLGLSGDEKMMNDADFDRLYAAARVARNRK